MFAIILDIEAQTWTPGAAGAPEITTPGKVGVGTTVPEGKIEASICIGYRTRNTCTARGHTNGAHPTIGGSAIFKWGKLQ